MTTNYSPVYSVSSFQPSFQMVIIEGWVCPDTGELIETHIPVLGVVAKVEGLYGKKTAGPGRTWDVPVFPDSTQSLKDEGYQPLHGHRSTSYRYIVPDKEFHGFPCEYEEYHCDDKESRTALFVRVVKESEVVETSKQLHAWADEVRRVRMISLKDQTSVV